MRSSKSLDARGLKAWARKNLPGNSKLREVILLDEDHMLPEAFLAKMDVWLALYTLGSNLSCRITGVQVTGVSIRNRYKGPK